MIAKTAVHERHAAALACLGANESDVLSRCRALDLVADRHLVWWLVCGRPLPRRINRRWTVAVVEVARLAGRDHSTVLAALNGMAPYPGDGSEAARELHHRFIDALSGIEVTPLRAAARRDVYAELRTLARCAPLRSPE